MNDPSHGGWATQNLAEFVALVFSMHDEPVALERAAERIAETLDADAVALVGEDEVHASTGFSAGMAPADALNASVTANGGEIEVPGAGSCPTVVVALDVEPAMHLLVARAGDDPLRTDELGLLRGMARVLGAALHSIRIIERERVLRERSERQARENARLLHGQFHDALTGLPNRALFIDRLDHALARAVRSHEDLAILVCDIDGFKAVNDSLGHAVGDDVLSQVARRLAASLRPGDSVARLAGDEFAVLLEELAEPGDAARTAQRLLESIGEPFLIGDRELSLTASIGIAAGAASPDELLRNADLALYRSQDGGPGNYAAFEPAMHAEIVDRMELEVDLRGAAQRGELLLHYQPILSLHSGNSVGVEALVRWQHPRRGLLSPEQFIHVAEQSGEILELGRWVLNEACRQATTWGQATSKASRLYVSANLSGAQLADPGLVADVTAALESSGLAPSQLMLEMTETVLMLDSDVNVQRLTALRELGIWLAIDDFGTGYSSLNYLSRFPIDTLKIAKVFVDPLSERFEEPAILRAMLDLAHIFGLNTIAEGVETAQQWERLTDLGCDLAQGFFRWPPADAQELQALFEPAGDATATGSTPAG